MSAQVLPVPTGAAVASSADSTATPQGREPPVPIFREQCMARALQFAVLQAVLVTCAAFVAAPVWRNEWPRSFISAQLHNEPHDRDIRTPSERIEAMGEPMQVGYVREEVDAKGANQKHNIQEMVALDTWWAVGEEAAAAVQLPAESVSYTHLRAHET